MAHDIDALAALACRLADAARAETLARFRRLDRAAEDKSGGRDYDPVTEADRAAEAAIRALLAAERPDDAILGEEEADRAGRSRLTWVIDPVDGTRAYLAGLPTWGTLIACDDGTRGIVGLVDHPATDERFLGTADGTARASWRGEWRDVAVRRTARLDEAILMTTDPALFGPDERAGFEAVRARTRLTRLGTDCYAYAMLAAGHVDLVIEAGLMAYDIAAPKALVEAAGGVVTDWRGGDCRWGGRVLAAATPDLAAAARDLLADG
ncbi:MAG: inositol monophosphatase family protein [Paracoccaceae bacterium]